jgi:hypothetical protein
MQIGLVLYPEIFAALNVSEIGWLWNHVHYISCYHEIVMDNALDLTFSLLKVNHIWFQ